MTQPTPFEIVDHDGSKLASDGIATVVVTPAAVAAGAKLMRTRAISGIPTKPVAEILLPVVNEFAGRLLSDPSIDEDSAAETLRAMAGLTRRPDPQRHEALTVDVPAGARLRITTRVDPAGAPAGAIVIVEAN
ncbi:MAG: hypothetical protein ACRCYZ_06915 [Alphaproteobacteria bacterium]